MGTKTEAIKAVASLDNKKWNSALDKMAKKTTGFKRVAVLGFKGALNGANKMMGGMKKLAKVGVVATAAAATGLGVLVTKTMNAGDEIDKMSKRTGTSAEFLSRLGYAADLGGTGLVDMETGFRRMQKYSQDAAWGLVSAQRAFDALEVTVTGTDGHLKNTEVLFVEVAEALSKVENNTERAAMAANVFGKSGTKLLPMLHGGKDALHKVMEESNQLAMIWTGKTALAAAELKDSFTRVKYVVVSMAQRFAVGLFPAVQKVSDKLTDWYKANKQLVDSKIEAWANTFAEKIDKAWAAVVRFAEDGRLKIWFEGAKATVTDLTAGVKALANQLAKITGPLSGLDWYADTPVGRAVAHSGPKSTSFTKEDVTSARAASAIGRNAGVGYPSLSAAGAGGGTTVINTNVTVNNSLAGNVDDRQAKAMGDAIGRGISRGQITLPDYKSKYGATL